MAIIIWLVIGAVIGFITGIVVHAAPKRRLVYVVLGIVGAVGGGAVVRGDRDPFDSTALIVAGLSAIILLGVVNLFRRSPAG